MISAMRIPFRKPGKYSLVKADPLLTERKFVELQNKLERMINSRPRLVAEVARLAETGDFSENAGYQNAKARLRGLNNAILVLEEQLKRAEILKAPTRTDVVQVGSTVVLEQDGRQRTYQILGSTETNPAFGIISHSSPLGSALLGRKIGERVMIRLANREVECKIVGIE